VNVFIPYYARKAITKHHTRVRIAGETFTTFTTFT